MTNAYSNVCGADCVDTKMDFEEIGWWIVYCLAEGRVQWWTVSAVPSIKGTEYSDCQSRNKVLNKDSVLWSQLDMEHHVHNHGYKILSFVAVMHFNTCYLCPPFQVSILDWAVH